MKSANWIAILLVSCATCLLVLEMAGGQDGPIGGKPDKWAMKGDKEAFRAEKEAFRTEKQLMQTERRESRDVGGIEDKAVQKVSDRMIKPGESERDKFIEEMRKVYRDQMSPGLSDADFAQWFGLLSNGGPEWRREFARKDIFELFDRVAERMNRGKNDSIGRDEFISYARYNLMPGTSPPWSPADPRSTAAKIFRELDSNRNGVLEPAEWSERLAADSRRVDSNRDGVIDLTEYQAYFEGRVTASLDRGPDPQTQSQKLNSPDKQPMEPKSFAIRAGHLPKGLPGWFEQIDTDHDGQIALYEWRAAGRSPAEFEQHDLNGDGLVTPDEYLRGVALTRERQQAEARSAGEEPSTERGNGKPMRQK